MHLAELFLLAVGLSMDAFAVAVCAGLMMSKPSLPKALAVGLYFGVFQAVMPVIGYFAAQLFAEHILSYDHWIAFALLCFLGGKMIRESMKQDDFSERDYAAVDPLKPAHILPLALATSIDALAVGVSFAFLQVQIVPAVSLIGVTTLLLSMLGVKIGSVFGLRFKSKAEFAGGVILILIGAKILLEHLHVTHF